MISLSALTDLAAEHRADLELPLVPAVVGGRLIDADAPTAVMGCLNLSRDSTYRASIAFTVDSAVRRGRAMAAQGADFVDVGAESSTASAGRVSAQQQSAALVPVVEQLTAAGVVVSVEAYHPEVVSAGLKAGARVVNYTGRAADEPVFDLVAEHGASVVLCYVPGGDVREVTDVELARDPVPGMYEHFAARVEEARRRGVESIVIDPGVGFYYGNLVDPMTRLRYQTEMILGSFRLRRLGLPICQALPHAVALFEDQYRMGEPFFAVLAQLGGVNVFRTHEVPGVTAVLNSMARLG